MWEKYIKRINLQRKIELYSQKYKNKKIVIYGAGLVYKALKQNYDLSKLNIVGVCDKSFGNEDKDFDGYKRLRPAHLSAFDFDVVLISVYQYEDVEAYLEKLLTKNREIKSLLAPAYYEFMNYSDYKAFLAKTNFEKHLKKLSKNYKDKKIVLFGAGHLYEAIKDNYDLSQLNIVAISDEKFNIEEKNLTFDGRKAVNPFNLDEIEFDLILNTTWESIKTREFLENNVFMNKPKPTIKPIIPKNLIQHFNEIRKLFHTELL